MLWFVPFAFAQDKPEPWDRDGWGFGALPAVNYNSDEGFGFGVAASAFKYDGGTSPYRTALNLLLFTTTRGVHSHSFEIDALQLGGKPIRLSARAELQTTRTSNYCGVGPDVSCDPAEAEDAADDAGLTGTEREDFLRHYYQTRFLNPIGTVNLRWELDPMPHRVELLAGWRGSYLVPGSFTESTPYAGSRYEQDFPGGEDGFTSVVQVGVMVDNRDNEPAPIRGYWAEASVRAASAVFGSDFDYLGFDAQLRAYAPLGTERLVFANRVMFDGIAGDATTLEQSIPGGSVRYVGFFGSLNAGRGVRLRRYIGKVKALEQAELRWTYASVSVGSSVIDFGVLGFADVGFVGEDFGAVGEMFAKPLPTTGGGLRFALDKNFVVRADVGVSPLEDWSPGVYIDLKNTF